MENANFSTIIKRSVIRVLICLALSAILQVFNGGKVDATWFNEVAPFFLIICLGIAAIEETWLKKRK